jgi:hypothetical protein
MKPFRRQRGGALHAVFSREEAEVVAALAAETGALVESARTGTADPDDPAVRRLLPDAYRDDTAASAEFRRFTADGLAERKAVNARLVVESLARGSGDRVEVWLDDPGAAAWLRTLTDIRLAIAARLGIAHDGDLGKIVDDESAYCRAVYDWLAYVQETLVMALHRR